MKGLLIAMGLVTVVCIVSIVWGVVYTAKVIDNNGGLKAVINRVWEGAK